MNLCRPAILCALLLSVTSLTAAQSVPRSAPEKLTVKAVRVAHAPTVDAILDDEPWAAAPEITTFTQHDPNDGQPATEKTTVKIVYTDDAIYVAATMFDDHPVTTLLARRDSDLESDWFGVGIDSQHDGLNGSSFFVNPSNVQYDANLSNDVYEDSSWDAVWSSAAKIVPGGWAVEMRIPFSQLRFAERPQQTWGINITRQINRNQELDRLVNVPKGQTGFVSRFADLVGLEGIRRQRTLELLPYAVTRSDLSSRIEASDPFGRHAAYDADAGLDLKYALTSNLTLTGTLNPDFGQVEVDPAVVNLSAFETFYPEKRPFFTEGAQIFRFGQAPARSRFNFNFYPPQFFYSRRIGRAPQASVSADYADEPGQTTILGAGKLTGKLGAGWTVGVLDALTDREHGSFQTTRTTMDGGTVVDRWSQTVEPMTNYFVGRATREYGHSRIGVMFTSVNRRIDDRVSYLRSDAYELGVDGFTTFRNKDWLLEWQSGTTLIEGSKTSMQIAQKSSARYYNRPDADYLDYDSERTSLSGTGGRVMLGKQTGKWRPNFQVQTYTPGFDVNDVGYMQRVDMLNMHAVAMYDDQDLHKYTRRTTVWVGKYDNFNYGGDHIGDGIYGNWSVSTNKYWEFFGSGGFGAPRWDDRETRGGPVVRTPASNSVSLGVESDERKKVSFELSAERDSDSAGGWYHTATTTLNYRPTTALRLSVAPSWTRMHEPRQYVAQIADSEATATYGKRYIFGELEEHIVDIGMRADWTLNSRLSLQLYLQPFLASGGYHDFKQLARPRSEDYTPFGPAATFDPATNAWWVSNAGTYFSFGNPDFNVRSVRGSAVARWEFRPGSALYVVWNENREEVLPLPDFRFRRDFGAIPDAPSRDVFLVKVSYWLPM